VSRRVDSTEMRVIAALRYRPFRRVIAISEAIAAVLRDRGVEDDRLVVIRSAVDAGRFAEAPDRAAFRREFNIPAGTFVIGAAGQLIPRKGHRFLLQAIADLGHGGRPIRLLIFGEGYLANQLRAQAASLRLFDVVQFVGFREDLDDYMGCFDLFVHPALSEGLGVATLKAQAAGVAVVGFAAGGLNEAVAHGQTGLLVPPEDIDALENAIRTLVADDDLRSRMGCAGRQRMQKDFAMVTMAARHVDIYESILNG
ncbi:MAG: glycosyltransferase family 4 protein, partial [Woeseiaceae bacterium]